MLRKRLRLPRSESTRLKQPTATFTKNGMAARVPRDMVIQNDWRARLNGQAADLVARQPLGLGHASLEGRRIHHLIE